MLDKIKKNNEGFTIIEVLIVLAIAGLIMLIVFLAVPALQRNNRNTQRNNDAARVAGAINECLGNNNGNLSSCDDIGELDPTYISIDENQQLIADGAAGLDGFLITTGTKCDGNASTTTGAGARSFTVTYQVETNAAEVDRCVSS